MSKMSKAQMQKMERERRAEFIRKATVVVCEEAVKSLDGCRNQVNITIKTGQGGRHRYIDVKRYKDGVGVSIYNDGNIDVTLREMVYEEVKFPLIRYGEMEDVGNAVDQVRDAVAAFLEVFFHGGMHVLMYYMCECEYGADWKECLTDYKKSHAAEKRKRIGRYCGNRASSEQLREISDRPFRFIYDLGLTVPVLRR